MQKIIFRVTEKYYGVPDPFVPDNTLLIMYQDFVAQIGKYHEANEQDRSPSFSHPKNWKEFSVALKKLVKNNYPDDYKDEDLSCYILPNEFINKLIWE